MDFSIPSQNNKIRKKVQIVDDYMAYRRTILAPCDDVYTDDIQSSYDYAASIRVAERGTNIKNCGTEVRYDKS